MVFYHASIPLTVSLRKESGGNDAVHQGKEFLRLLLLNARCLSGSDVPSSGLEEAWDYEYETLWEARFGKMKFIFLNQAQKVRVLKERTYWYKRLKPNVRRMVEGLLADRKGTLRLKEILHTVDGAISSLIVSYPEALFTSPDPKTAYAISDRVMNSIISNCIFNYAEFQRNWKQFKKELRKAAFLREEYHPNERFIRKMSWVRVVLEKYNLTATSNSKAKMFRVCAFTQTRATGLADSKMMETAIDEFIDAVTVKKSFEPDRFLMEAIDFVCERIAVQASGYSPHFRVSMSTSACTETKKKDEGKFGHLKQRFRNHEIPPIPKFSPDNPGGQIGNLVFREARQMIRASDPNIWKMNVAAVRENGKCRIVGAGSFYKDALLQPFSHMTIEAAKNEPLLRDSFQAARLGYKFVEGITHLDPVRGAILFEEDVLVASFDWKKATDRPTHASAHLTMGTLLRKMNTPQDVIDDVFSIWPGQMDLHVNGKYVGRAVNGIPMGHPLTKTNLSIAHPICAAYADLVVGKLEGTGAGNGDDGVEIKAGPLAQSWISAFLEAARQLGYELSEDDYFVTRDWFTYCEEVAMIPIDRFHTVANASRMKSDKLLPYLDVPKFRLVIDTKKDRRDFSSDPKGKYTLLGKDMEYVRKGGENQVSHLFSVASSMQDVCLGLKYQSIPVYIPRQVFGIGKIPTNWNPVSWANAVMSQRSHPRNVTYTVLRELTGERECILTKLRGVMSGNTHFDKESYVEIKTIPADDPIRKFVCVPAEKWKLFPAGVLQRLRGNGRLVPESKIQAFYLFQSRVQELSQDQPVDLFDTIKAMSNELDVATKDDVVRVATKMRDRYSNSPWTLGVEREEDLYPRSVVEVLEKSNPLRVDLPEFQYLNRFTKPPKVDSPFQRALNTLEEWFYDNYEDVLAGREFSLPPTDVIEDDPIIIMQIERSICDIIIVITNDRRLVNQAVRKIIGKHIWRISVENWLNHDLDEGAFKKVLKERLGDIPIEFIVDQGAIETYLMKTDIDPTRYPGFAENIERSKVRSQADIYDVYTAPRPLNPKTIFEIVEIPRYSLTRKGALPRTQTRT